ncbi:MAG TPA: Mrp/NBP35 family ATP-binding protein [Chitinophagaceae bacterium]|nr:Mrp/NBP35 family ATP-binding protein [Chitinophagaceae bacterium]
MISKDDIRNALKQVEDPQLGGNLADLNMIKQIKISEDAINIRIELKTPKHPQKEDIRNKSIEVVQAVAGDNITIHVQFTAVITSGRDNKAKTINGIGVNDNLLPNVKNIIAVASGKGGVGKSTVAANLAIALGKEGAKVGLMDADIYGPSAPIMFGLRGERPKMTKINGKGMIMPMDRYGVKVISIGLLVDEKQAVVWRGPMVSSAIKQFVSDVYWGELDYLVIDLPPGTGDIHLTMVQTIPVTGAVIVTTPQQVALADAKKGVAMFSTGAIKVPVLGIVENMSYFTPPELPDKKYYIFGKDGAKRICSDFNIPLLGEIPIVESICEGGDVGIPALMGDDEITKKAFSDFADETARHIAIRNENLDPTKIVEMVR